MPLVIFNLKEEEKSAAVEKLILDSSPRQEFFLMIVLSVLMATFGLLIGNASVVIGSMLIAPLLSPVLSLSLGIVLADNNLISRSGYVVLKSVGFSVIAAAIVTIFFKDVGDLASNSYILERATPSLIFFIIAFVAGLAGTFASIRPNLSALLPGVAISVALIPPVSVIGIGLAYFRWEIIAGALLLFLVNIIGIVFAGMIVFSLSDFYRKRKRADEVIREEDKAIAQEEHVENT